MSTPTITLNKEFHGIELKFKNLHFPKTHHETNALYWRQPHAGCENASL